MKIERIIDGKTYSFELTSSEMLQAYLEQEHDYDINDIRGELIDIADGYGFIGPDKFKDIFHLPLEAILLNDYVVDIMADEKRHLIDTYGTDWYEAVKESITDVMQLPYYQNLRLALRINDALFCRNYEKDRDFTEEIYKDLEDHKYDMYLRRLKDILSGKYASNPKEYAVLFSLVTDLEFEKNKYLNSLADGYDAKKSGKMLSSTSSLACESEKDFDAHSKETCNLFSRIEELAPYGAVVKTYSLDPFNGMDEPEYIFVFPGEYQDILSAFPSKNGVDLMSINNHLTACIYGDNYSYVNTGQTHLEEALAEYKFFADTEKMEDLKTFLESACGDINSSYSQKTLMNAFEDHSDSHKYFMDSKKLIAILQGKGLHTEKLTLPDKIKAAEEKRAALESTFDKGNSLESER